MKCNRCDALAVHRLPGGGYFCTSMTLHELYVEDEDGDILAGPFQNTPDGMREARLEAESSIGDGPVRVMDYEYEYTDKTVVEVFGEDDDDDDGEDD